MDRASQTRTLRASLRLSTYITLALSVFFASHACRAAITPGQDLFLATGTTSPLALSWKPIEPDSMVVKVDGTVQVAGIDYTEDDSAGTVTFLIAPAAGSAVSVSYSYDTASAQEAGSPFSLPLSWDLKSSGSESLQFNTTYSQSQSASKLQMGLADKWSGRAGSFFQTQAFYAPGSAADDTSGGSFDRAALDLSAGMNAGRWAKFNFGYDRAGLGVAGVSDSNLPGAGQQAASANAALTFSKQLSATMSYKQLDTLDTPTGGARDSSTQENVAVAAQPSSTLSISSQVAVTQATGSTQSVASSVSVKAQPLKTVQLAADAAQSDPGGTISPTQTENLSATVAATKALSLQATATQTSTGPTDTQQQTASANWKPTGEMQVGASFTSSETQAYANEIAGVSLSDKPMRFLSVDAAYRDREASLTDPNSFDRLDTTSVGLTLIPLHSLQLSDTFETNPDDSGAADHALQNAVQLSSTLFGITLAGFYKTCQLLDEMAFPESASYGLNASFGVFHGVKLTGSYSNTLAGGASLSASQTYSMGLAKSVTNRLNLAVSANVTQQNQPASVCAQQTDYQARADLGLKF